MATDNDSTVIIDNILDRHKSFWHHCEVDEPLVQKVNFVGFKSRPYFASGGRTILNPTRIYPDDIDAHRLLGLDRPNISPLSGCKVNCIGPVLPEAWMESLIGCPIYASEYSCTAKPVNADIRSAAEFSLDDAMGSPWLKVMDDVIRIGVDFSKDAIGVRQLHLRGIIDMLAAYLGEESLCIGMLDAKDEIGRLAQKFMQLYIKTALRGLSQRPLWKGGYVSSWGLFSPGTLLDYQVDASNMVSSGLYNEMLVKYDAEIVSNFDYSLIHVHSCGMHIIDSLLKIDQLDAIELSLDREAGVWEPERTVEYCKKIQKAKKSVLICGQLSQSELDYLLLSLSPASLAVFYWEPV